MRYTQEYTEALLKANEFADKTIKELFEKIGAQAETIKGLDRATVHNTACFARLEEIINTQDKTIEQKDATIKDLQERLDYHLEADASRPTRDVNGTIEALHGLVAKLKGDVLKLQAKVKEQDERDYSIKNEINCRIEHGAESNHHLEGIWEMFYKGVK